jgi:hypothetical protein
MMDEEDGIGGCFGAFLLLLAIPIYAIGLIIFGPIILIFKLLDGDE